MLVVHEQSLLPDVGDGDNLDLTPVVQDDALLAVGPEPDRLALLQVDEHVGARFLGRDRGERALVEDVAALVHLDGRRSPAGLPVAVMCLRCMPWVRATNVASAPNANESGLNGWSIDPNGVDFVTLPTSLVGEYWPFVKP